MSAEALETVSWRGVKGFGSIHLVPVGGMITLCMRRIPKIGRVSRGCSGPELCRGCVVVLDHIGKKRLELTQ